MRSSSPSISRLAAKLDTIPKHWYVCTCSSLQLKAEILAVASDGPYISPALLGRARSIAAEHGKLARQLSDGYDTSIAKKVGELSTAVGALKEWESASNVRCNLPRCRLLQSLLN